jgi:hypothetical protein
MRSFLACLVLFSASHAFLFGQHCTLDVKTGGAPPVEVNAKVAPGTCGFLQFAWQAFLAENWPPLPVDPTNTTQKARGLPDASQTIGQSGDNATVWQQYQPNWYLFQPNDPPPNASAGQSFAAWNQNSKLPSSCGQQAASQGVMILSAISKLDPMPGIKQAFSEPLIDQTGYYARYDIQLSYEAFNYINSNQYYLAAKQTPTTTFSFPTQNGATPGAVFVKSAWKTLSATEVNSGRFHTALAFLYSPASFVDTCVGPVTVGLVGLHIVQKTAAFPESVWATFEQVDNTPADPANPPSQSWSFFNPTSKTTPNTAPTCPNTINGNCDWQPTSSHLGDKTGGPTQVVRTNPIPKSQNQPALGEINQSVQAGLKAINPNSVWQYYELVDAQWQKAGTSTGFFPPNNVLNSVAETYFQIPPVKFPMSCMVCHQGATAANGKPSDFSFELGLAWAPTVLPANRVPAMHAPPVHKPAPAK